MNYVLYRNLRRLFDPNRSTALYYFTHKYTFCNVLDVPDIPTISIKKALKGFGASFQEGYACFIVPCTICSKRSKSKIYINKTTGYFQCDGCSNSGQWTIFEKLFTTKKPAKNLKLENDELSPWDHVTKTTEVLGDDIENYHGIDRNVLTKLGARIDKKHIYFPLYDIRGTVKGYKVLKPNTDEESTVPSSGDGGVAIYETSKNSRAIVVPSIPDLIALSNCKLQYAVVCLPYGLLNLPQATLPSFERFDELVLWFGNGTVSRHFARKLGEKRCLFIRPTEKYPVPRTTTDVSDIKSIISNAKPVWHKSITTFASLRQDVLCDLHNIDKVRGVKWKRYPTLNRILKGHRPGELTVMTGPTGCGKTTFMSEYSLDLAIQGVNTLWGSFEIRNARLARTMLQQMAGVPLEENLDKFDTFADEFEKLPVHFMTFHGQQTIKVVMEAVEHAAYVHDIAHVVIDNVQFMMGLSDEYRNSDRFWKQDAIVAAFRAFATRRDCHVTLVIHPRKERDDEDLTASSIFGGAKASQEADNVLIVQDRRSMSTRGKKYLQIVKNRYSGDLGIVPLDFDKTNLSYAQKKKKKDMKEKSDTETEAV